MVLLVGARPSGDIESCEMVKVIVINPRPRENNSSYVSGVEIIGSNELSSDQCIAFVIFLCVFDIS